MKWVRKEKIANVLAGSLFLSFFVMFFCLKHNGHECEYDECMRIWYRGNLGICVEKAIDDLCSYLPCIWYMAVIGSAVVMNAIGRNKRNDISMSVFLFLAAILAVSVFAALLDPSKWGLFFAMLGSAVIFIAIVALDDSDRNSGKRA